MGRRKKSENVETGKELAVVNTEVEEVKESAPVPVEEKTEPRRKKPADAADAAAAEGETVEATAEPIHEAEYKEAEATEQAVPESASLELAIEAELFSGLREAFNSTLQALLDKVTSREVDEGEVNLKLVITLENQNVLGHTVVSPSFKHVVTGNYKEKIENKGAFGIPQTYLAKDSNGKYELKALEDNLFSNQPMDEEVQEATA